MKLGRIEEHKNVPWNKGLKKEKPEWQTSVDDDGKLYQRYLNKKINAEKEGIQCLLTFEEYCSLVKAAGLKSSQLGFSEGSGKYVLARYEDKGNYTYNNCRFITQSENAFERKVSDKSREASRNNALKMNQHRPEDISDRIRKGMESSPYYIEKRKKAQEKQLELDKLKNPSYKGSKNSQYGTYWITDGKENRKWNDTMGEIPVGFRRGRVILPK